jgi:hypothetical protein
MELEALHSQFLNYKPVVKGKTESQKNGHINCRSNKHICVVPEATIIKILNNQ